jgi:hypothetical protein
MISAIPDVAFTQEQFSMLRHVDEIKNYKFGEIFVKQLKKAHYTLARILDNLKNEIKTFLGRLEECQQK